MNFKKSSNPVLHLITVDKNGISGERFWTKSCGKLPLPIKYKRLIWEFRDTFQDGKTPPGAQQK